MNSPGMGVARSGYARAVRRVTAELLLLTLLFSLVIAALVRRTAAAHNPGGGTIRVNTCANAAKYACQLYYVLRQNTIYGWIYDARHIHNCTDQGGDSSAWRVPFQKIHNTISGDSVTFQYIHNVNHYGLWCGGGVHTFDSSGGTWTTASGANHFEFKVEQDFPGYTQVCHTHLYNFSGSSDYNDGNTNIC